MRQGVAWWISVIPMLGLALVFAAVARRAGETGEAAGIGARAAVIRRALFWLAVLAGIPVAWLTLRALPYPDGAGAATQVVRVAGLQWAWTISPDTVVAGRPVELQVTSMDVNHGFGVYDETMTLVAQVQAMPGYTNRLRLTFARPGRYQILCLEYCGLAHHVMRAEIVVTQPTGVRVGSGAAP